jgi:hypothetical protein
MLQITNLHANVGDNPILKGTTRLLVAVEAQKLLGISLEESVR